MSKVIAVVIIALMATHTSASFFDAVRGAFQPLETSVSKLFNDVVSDLRTTIDCTILAVEQVFSWQTMFGRSAEYYAEKCTGHKKKANDTAIAEAVKNNNIKEKNMMALHEKMNETIRNAEEARLIEEAFKDETLRLQQIHKIICEELDKLSADVEKRTKKLDHDVASTETVLSEVRQLYEIEQHDKSSSRANEVRQTFDKILNLLQVNDTGGVFSDDEEVKQIMKGIGTSLGNAMDDVEVQFKEWKKGGNKDGSKLKRESKHFHNHDIDSSDIKPKNEIPENKKNTGIVGKKETVKSRENYTGSSDLFLFERSYPIQNNDEEVKQADSSHNSSADALLEQIVTNNTEAQSPLKNDNLYSTKSDPLSVTYLSKPSKDKSTEKSKINIDNNPLYQQFSLEGVQFQKAADRLYPVESLKILPTVEHDLEKPASKNSSDIKSSADTDLPAAIKTVKFESTTNNFNMAVNNKRLQNSTDSRLQQQIIQPRNATEDSQKSQNVIDETQVKESVIIGINPLPNSLQVEDTHSQNMFENAQSNQTSAKLLSSSPDINKTQRDRSSMKLQSDSAISKLTQTVQDPKLSEIIYGGNHLSSASSASLSPEFSSSEISKPTKAAAQVPKISQEIQISSDDEPQLRELSREIPKPIQKEETQVSKMTRETNQEPVPEPEKLVQQSKTNTSNFNKLPVPENRPVKAVQAQESTAQSISEFLGASTTSATESLTKMASYDQYVPSPKFKPVLIKSDKSDQAETPVDQSKQIETSSQYVSSPIFNAIRDQDQSVLRKPDSEVQTTSELSASYGPKKSDGTFVNSGTTESRSFVTNTEMNSYASSSSNTGYSCTTGDITQRSQSLNDGPKVLTQDAYDIQAIINESEMSESIMENLFSNIDHKRYIFDQPDIHTYNN